MIGVKVSASFSVHLGKVIFFEKRRTIKLIIRTVKDNKNSYSLFSQSPSTIRSVVQWLLAQCFPGVYTKR